jgi:hypothetical protein
VPRSRRLPLDASHVTVVRQPATNRLLGGPGQVGHPRPDVVATGFAEQLVEHRRPERFRQWSPIDDAQQPMLDGDTADEDQVAEHGGGQPETQHPLGQQGPAGGVVRGEEELVSQQQITAVHDAPLLPRTENKSAAPRRVQARAIR